MGLIPAVPRKSSGVRDYDEQSCGWVEFIRCMRNAGLPVESLIEYVQLFQQGNSTHEARRQLLVEERAKLHERIGTMLATRDRLDYKIANYDKMSEKMRETIG